MRPAVVLNAGVTGITVLVQMLVMIARVCARACVRVMVLLLIRLKGASGCLSLSSAISVLKYGGGKRKRGSGRVSMCQC